MISSDVDGSLLFTLLSASTVALCIGYASDLINTHSINVQKVAKGYT